MHWQLRWNNPSVHHENICHYDGFNKKAEKKNKKIKKLTREWQSQETPASHQVSTTM